MTFNPLYCSGVDARGHQCHCRRHVPSPTDPTTCTCVHPEGYHPELSTPLTPAAQPNATPSSIVAKWMAPAMTATPAPASTQLVASSSKSKPVSSQQVVPLGGPSASSAKAVAFAETSSGLKRKRVVSDDATGPAPSKKSKTKKKTRGEGEILALGQVVIVPTEPIDEKGSLYELPKKTMISLYESRGLAVNGLRKPYSIDRRLSAEEMDGWLRGDFVSFFQYLDRWYKANPTASPPVFHWKLLIQDSKTLTVSSSLNPDGAEVTRYFGQNSKAAARTIYLAPSHPISAAVWDHAEGWKMDVEPEPEYMDSESDTASTEPSSESEGSWVNPDGDDASRHAACNSDVGKGMGQAATSPVLSISSTEDTAPGAPYTQNASTSVRHSPRLDPWTPFSTIYKHFVSWDPADIEVDADYWSRDYYS
ncbi:hypothetical protein R3P38DRAFT_3425812 [Favolaschia claudopus]|uniref:Uncharacterized protein n=1 Tax=Favolaschia claudopus TaxID=2862362 RepID=A0AAV9ZWS6_9AGAR